MSVKSIIKAHNNMFITAIKNQPWWIKQVAINAIQSKGLKDFGKRHMALTEEVQKKMAPSVNAFYKECGLENLIK